MSITVQTAKQTPQLWIENKNSANKLLLHVPNEFPQMIDDKS